MGNEAWQTWVGGKGGGHHHPSCMPCSCLPLHTTPHLPLYLSLSPFPPAFFITAVPGPSCIIHLFPLVSCMHACLWFASLRTELSCATHAYPTPTARCCTMSCSFLTCCATLSILAAFTPSPPRHPPQPLMLHAFIAALQPCHCPTMTALSPPLYSPRRVWGHSCLLQPACLIFLLVPAFFPLPHLPTLSSSLHAVGRRGGTCTYLSLSVHFPLLPVMPVPCWLPITYMPACWAWAFLPL